MLAQGSYAARIIELKELIGAEEEKFKCGFSHWFLRIVLKCLIDL